MTPHTDTRRRLLATLAALPLLAVAACGRKPPLRTAIPAGARVLALGDSLTAGVGTTPADSWPARLASASGWQVINAGVSGDTSAGALQRLPALLAEHRPALVIVSIGGNDFLRRINERDTRRAIADICRAAQAASAQVVLVGVPRPSALTVATRRLSDHSMYAELAKECDAPLYANGWSAVLADDRLRADTIHANAAGQALFTEGLVTFLRSTGLLRPA